MAGVRNLPKLLPSTAISPNRLPHQSQANNKQHDGIPRRPITGQTSATGVETTTGQPANLARILPVAASAVPAVLRPSSAGLAIPTSAGQRNPGYNGCALVQQGASRSTQRPGVAPTAVMTTTRTTATATTTTYGPQAGCGGGTVCIGGDASRAPGVVAWPRQPDSGRISKARAVAAPVSTMASSPRQMERRRQMKKTSGILAVGAAAMRVPGLVDGGWPRVLRRGLSTDGIGLVVKRDPGTTMVGKWASGDHNGHGAAPAPADDVVWEDFLQPWVLEQ